MHKSKKYNWFTAIIGHALERYEVTLFGYFIPVLSPLFFPNHQGYASLIAMSTFAAGYWVRPIGGIVFGHIGDRFGRKSALVISMLCVTIPTFILSFLPTYASIGIIAPIILILCRVSQGISIGAEYSGAAVYSFELSKKSQRGLAGGIMSATAFLGTLCGTVIGMVSSHLFHSNWSWRFPLMIGGVLGLIVFSFRRKIIETPIFNGFNREERRNLPLYDILKKKKGALLETFFLAAQGHILLYIITIYFNSIVLKKYGFAQAKIMEINSIILFAWVLLILIFSYLSDKVEKRKFLIGISCCTLVGSLPFFMAIYNTFSVTKLFFLEGFLSMMGSAYYGISASYLPGLYEPEERYTGVAFGQTMGQAVLGGSAPLLAMSLSFWVGDIISPALILSINSLFLILCLWMFNLKKV